MGKCIRDWVYLVYLITCNTFLKQYVGQTVDMLDHDGITIKIILGNLREEKTLCKATFTNIFSYQVILVIMLLSLMRPILGHPLSVKITGFIPLRQKHLWDLILKKVTELLSYIAVVQLYLFLDMDGLF